MMPGMVWRYRALCGVSFAVISVAALPAEAQPLQVGSYQLRQGASCVKGGAAEETLVLEACDPGPADQQWRLVDHGDEAYGLQNDSTGLVFDVSGNSTASGTPLISWQGNGQPNQSFGLVERGDAFALASQAAPQQCVTAGAGSLLELQPCDANNPAQAFTFDAVMGPDNPRACGEEELLVPRYIENTQGGPGGANVAVITRGYMMVLFAPDSGRPPGVLHFYDISNPRNPTLSHRVDDEHTARFREAHSMPIALVDGREYVAIQTIDGIQFWDLTDPLSASYVNEIDLPGVSGGDYENVAWQADWQGKYLFVSGANQGIYVVDTSDIANPRLLRQVPTGTTGGFRVGPLFARGPYLVIANMDQNGSVSVLDITVPDTPTLLATTSGLPRLYTIAATGDRIYGAGRDGDFTIHSFDNPTRIDEVSVTRIEQDSLYVAPQDHFVFSGRQNNFVKIDVSNEAAPVLVAEGDLGRTNPDHGQVTPIGNWLFIGNDHGTGSALFCHAQEDDLPPAVQKVFPPDQATHQDPGSRVTLVFSDYIDTQTISRDTVAVRPNGGAVLSGIYTYNFNTLSFSPNEPLQAETTYEIVLAAAGVHDVTGNGLASDLVFRFSTGAAVEAPIEPEPVDPGAGGADAGTAPPSADASIDPPAGGSMDPGMPSATGGAAPLGAGGVPPLGTDSPPSSGGVPTTPAPGDGASGSPSSSSGCACTLGATGPGRTHATWQLILLGALGSLVLRRNRP